MRTFISHIKQETALHNRAVRAFVYLLLLPVFIISHIKEETADYPPAGRYFIRLVVASLLLAAFTIGYAVIKDGAPEVGNFID